VRDLRRSGSAALDLCHVGAGRLDGYYERGLHPWDMAAAALVVTEAGGVVSGLDAPPSGEMVLATTPELHEDLHALLRRLHH
nr:inositol monophosphatase [Actinomycetota bacterium]